MRKFKSKLSLEKFVVARFDNTNKITGGSELQNTINLETITGIPDSDACFPPRD
jgi:hypothetical protein